MILSTTSSNYNDILLLFSSLNIGLLTLKFQPDWFSSQQTICGGNEIKTVCHNRENMLNNIILAFIAKEAALQGGKVHLQAGMFFSTFVWSIIDN